MKQIMRSLDDDSEVIVNEVKKDDIIVITRNGVADGLVMSDDYDSKNMHELCFLSFSKHNQRGRSEGYKSLEEMMEHFHTFDSSIGHFEFYAFHTLREAFEFAIERGV